jgi:hypothetical protein
MDTASNGRLERRAGGGHSQMAARRSGGDRRAPAETDAAVRQALLLQLALKALDRIIADYSELTRRQPSYAALERYLDELERGGGLQPAPARAVEPPQASRAEMPALLQPMPRATAA